MKFGKMKVVNSDFYNRIRFKIPFECIRTFKKMEPDQVNHFIIEFEDKKVKKSKVKIGSHIIKEC